ncbi:MAG: 4-(cytidine 5'-diphospho)-2-C-methyl-D-erythritol kinase [Clostridia bacterium]|nr:4-(cytidine 5'-diphospho)-2-C-methyl-D-erythritol kinase [Clostridia bacterium]
MKTSRVNAYAKLNLTLDIVGEKDGYHLLDSLVVTVNLSDRIVAKKRKDHLVSVRMHGMKSESIPPEENNALKAGEAFVARFGTTGADITVYKNIPIGAGLGGSSADAAGVLNAMARLYEISDGAALKELADSLGSDTGYLLQGGLARMTGRGERVARLSCTPELWFLVLCPQDGVSTPQCYAAYDELGIVSSPRTERALSEIEKGNAEWAALNFGNDLFEPAAQLNPAVKEALSALRHFSPSGAGMTGSGSACFAAFPTRELCEWAKSRYRGKCRAYVLKSIDPKNKRGVKNIYSVEDEEE